MWETKHEEGDFIIHTRIYPKPKHYCAGVNSEASGNRHIVMIDYDEADFSVVEKDITHIRNLFGISTFFIYQTGKDSWHIRCPEKVTYQTLYKIISETHCDPHVLEELTGSKRKITHRISPRGTRPAPWFVSIEMSTPKYEISKMHYDLFKSDVTDKVVLGKLTEFEKLANFDDSVLNKLPVVVYGTAKGSDGHYD